MRGRAAKRRDPQPEEEQRERVQRNQAVPIIVRNPGACRPLLRLIPSLWLRAPLVWQHLPEPQAHAGLVAALNTVGTTAFEDARTSGIRPGQTGHRDRAAAPEREGVGHEGAYSVPL